MMSVSLKTGEWKIWDILKEDIIDWTKIMKEKGDSKMFPECLGKVRRNEKGDHEWSIINRSIKMKRK